MDTTIKVMVKFRGEGEAGKYLIAQKKRFGRTFTDVLKVALQEKIQREQDWQEG